MTDKPPFTPLTKHWTQPVTSSKVVVVAASAGGLVPLLELLSTLPSDFPAAVVVVQHGGPAFPELLPSLVAERSALRVRHASTGDLLEAGTVYICPPGAHLTTEYALHLVDGPRLDFVRPSVAFRSAARTHGPGVVVVVLSGCSRNGAAGCEWIAASGGAVIGRGVVDETLPVAALAEALVRRTTAVLPAAPAGSTRVLLVDDHRLLLDGLRVLLCAEQDIDVIADAVDGREAVRLARTLSPDVVVMDIGMPHLDGIEATRRIRALDPRTKIVALSAYMDARMAERVLDAGASGYLDKNVAFEELARAIRTVASGRRYVSSRIHGLPPYALSAAAGISRQRYAM